MSQNKTWVFMDSEFIPNQGIKSTIPVCCSLHIVGDKQETKSFWLYGDKKFDLDSTDTAKLKNTLNALKATQAVFVAYAATAEMSCFLALDLDPRDFIWIDLMAEWRHLRNARRLYSKPKHGSLDSLANVTCVLTGDKIDLEYKDKMRDKILNLPLPRDVSYETKEEIVDYCEQDVADLHKILFSIWGLFTTEVYTEKWSGKKEDHDDFLYNHIVAQQIERGFYLANVAVIEQRGYPIDLPGLKQFDKDTSLALRQFQEQAVVRRSKLIYQRKVKGEITYVMRRKLLQLIATKAAISLKYDWARVSTKKTREKPYRERNYETGVEQLEYALKFYTALSQEDKGILREAIEYSGLQNPRKFFTTRKGSRAYTDFTFRVSSEDYRMRPYLNAFGGETFRNQASAKSFLPAQNKSIKRFIRPVEGMRIVALDYKAQETLISALYSQDINLLEDYKDDIYIGFGRRIGIWDGKKSTRDMLKTAFLGLSYGASPFGLMWHVRHKLCIEFSLEEAERIHREYQAQYRIYHRFREMVLAKYRHTGSLHLPDGSVLGPNNNNPLSITNWAIQATGGMILRKAVCELGRRYPEIQIIYTVHDSIVIECLDALVEEHTAIVKHIMVESFESVMKCEKGLIKIEVD